jgi:hypothetical protein
MPMLSVTSNSLDIRSVDGSLQTKTTYLYSLGGASPVNYTLSMPSGSEAPWLTLNTPTSGTITSIPSGGSLVPITFTVDFSKVPANDDGEAVNIIGVLKVTGGTMPVYVGIGAQHENAYPFLATSGFSPLTTTFNKEAIPDYHGGSGGPSPTPTPTPQPGTATPTATPTATKTPSTATPTATPGGTVSMLVGDTTVEAVQDSNPPGMAEAFQYTAAASGAANRVSVYVDAANTANSLLVGLYSDRNNNPRALLARAAITAPTKGAWNTVAIPAVQITSGKRYWIAVLGPAGGGTPQFRTVSSGRKAQTSSQANLTSLPATWSRGTNWFNSPMSAYASHF